MISTPFVPVPPPRYGGTELIVAELVTGLTDAGHEVTLFATGDSRPSAGVALRARFERASWPPRPYIELDHVGFAVEQILGDARGFDVVHAHLPSALPFAAMIDAPMVYTVHHDNGADYTELQSLYRRSRAHFVAISARQRQLMQELADAHVIHHGLDPAGHRFGRGDGGYCAFLGRMAREKGPHLAIDVARAAGVPIRLGGAPHWRDHDYFERELRARMTNAGVTAVGEVGGVDKRELLADASALLFPVDWEEPFGLVMIEAMLSGTPVLAFERGSVSEVVEDGVTGFICRDADEMAARLRAIETFDRAACRRRALEKWTAARMVRDYVAVYETLQAWVEMSEQPRLLPEIVAPAESALILPVSGETEPLVLSRGNTFGVLKRRGDIAPAGARDLGLFHDDTRHLSYLELFVSGGPAVVLSSETWGAASSQVDLTLTDREFGGFLDDPQNFLHVRRKQILDGSLVEQIVLTNHLRRPVELWLELRMGADFADVFEVRGFRRARRGRLLPPDVGVDRITFGYDGLDGQRYRTLVLMNPVPTRIDAGGPRWELRLEPGEATMLEVVIQPRRGDELSVPMASFGERRQRLQEQHERFLASTTHIRTDNVAFDDTLRHALEDLDALRLSIDCKNRPPLGILGAGIPWFAAPFGRDSILTSLELLSVAPSLAMQTLRTLAYYQGSVDDAWREEEPGKIMHELRRGELARAGEVPHAPYYGSIDATPLWLVLFGESWRWLGDRALVDELLPHAERALVWIERRLMRGHGWVRYERTHDKGLENQGWKDSRDGVSFPDGTIAPAPIALVEVQGYVVGALEAMAMILRVVGAAARADRLQVQADALRRRIQDEFWVRETGFYALAIDGTGRQVPTITSNPGHLLFVDGLPRERATRLVDVLLGEGLFSGWGVRTLARGQAVFNPLSYHNGSVWPHDNALVALGAARHERSDAALCILEGLYLASQHFRHGRLPELFCGLGRSEGDFLVHYPVSCSPQAWASGAFFLLLQACLGLRPNAAAHALAICDPRLPSFLDKIDLRGLRVGNALVSLHFERHGSHTHCDVLEVTGDRLRVNIEV